MFINKICKKKKKNIYNKLFVVVITLPWHDIQNTEIDRKLTEFESKKKWND